MIDIRSSENFHTVESYVRYINYIKYMGIEEYVQGKYFM
jgi:hypothetical protein